MRVLLFLGALLLASPALAISDKTIDYCFTMQDPKLCMKTFLLMERNLQAEGQRERERQLEAQREAQLEQARTQANDKALFGAGNALINGMNQGLQNMQLPYNQPPGRR